jgi:acyl-CoA thioesterase-1
MEKEMDENSIKKEYKIVAFGDSLTAGYGVDLKDSYPSILEENLKKKAEAKNTEIKIINMGVSGETTSGGVDRVEFVISQNPNLVLLGLGANDMLRSTAPSLTRDNLDKIIKSFKDKNIKVILLGMESQITNGIEYRKEFNSIYPDLSEKYDLPLVPFFLKGVVLVPSLNTADSIHPNRMGYEKIIKENVEPVLLPYLKKIKII